MKKAEIKEHLDIMYDISYILNCLAQDLTGEAKSELSLLAAKISRSTLFEEDERSRVLGKIQAARSGGSSVTPGEWGGAFPIGESIQQTCHNPLLR